MQNEEKIYDLIKFEDGELSLDVRVEPSEDTVWLTQLELAYLFETTKQNISIHINNILKEKELDINSTVKNSFTVQVEGDRVVKRLTT